MLQTLLPPSKKNTLGISATMVFAYWNAIYSSLRLIHVWSTLFRKTRNPDLVYPAIVILKFHKCPSLICYNLLSSNLICSVCVHCVALSLRHEGMLQHTWNKTLTPFCVHSLVDEWSVSIHILDFTVVCVYTFSIPRKIIVKDVFSILFLTKYKLIWT